MSFSERDLEKYGEQFIVILESLSRALNLYPPNHPTIGAQCQRFVDSFAELRELTGDSVINLVNGELYVNCVPLKRLSLAHQPEIGEWEKKGLGLITFAADLLPGAVLPFLGVISQTREELRALGGIPKALDAAGVVGIRAGRVAVGMAADSVSMVDAAQPEPEEDEGDLDPDEARARYRDGFGRLLVAVQNAAAVDPRVRYVRNLSQLIESRLLTRRAVRDLAARLREHDKESYRHALGGAVVSVLMAAAIGVEPQRLRQLGEAALLRDIGKLRIPPEILHNPDRDPTTRAEYEKHTFLGAKILFAERAVNPFAAIVANEHHARLDGKGFPKLKARSAPHAFSRIVAVASDYDKMTGGYPGAAVMSVWEAVGAIIQGVGSSYDASAVRAFLRVMGCVPEGTPVRLVDNREGIVAGTGQKTWLCPEVAILRDPEGNEIGPEIVPTDDLAQLGESAIHSYLQVTERDMQRLEALRDIE